VNNLDHPIGLAEYLTYLREELSEAQSRASGDPLKLGVQEITVALDIAYTLTKSGEASAALKAKFWVLASAEAGAKGSLASSNTRTQRLTLTLKPRLEEVSVDQAGVMVMTRGLDVEGQIEKDEENPTTGD
jgi:hypothetical protein